MLVGEPRKLPIDIFIVAHLLDLGSFAEPELAGFGHRDYDAKSPIP